MCAVGCLYYGVAGSTGRVLRSVGWCGLGVLQWLWAHAVGAGLGCRGVAEQWV